MPPSIRSQAVSSIVQRVRRRLRNAWRHWTHVARKLLAISLRERFDLALAQLVILWAHAVVRVRPVGSLVVIGEPAGPAPSAISPAERAVARRLALAVSRVATFGVSRPLCLVRAVALKRLLELHGIRGSLIRVGVRLEAQQFAAHAWVELGEDILGDYEWHVDRFSELSGLTVAHREK